MRDCYCCLLSFHVKVSLNLKKKWTFNMMLLCLEYDFHDSVRLSSSCESSESGVEAVMTPHHMLGILRNSFHLAEHWCQTRALETLSLSLLKVKLTYLIDSIHLEVTIFTHSSNILLFSHCHNLGEQRDPRQPVISCVSSLCYVCVVFGSK